MESMRTTCPNCTKPLPNVGYFCGVCLTQFKCKSCGANLEKDYAGCAICGTPREIKSSLTGNGQNVNSFRMHEKFGERIIEATFSDNVGKDLADMIKDTYALRMGSNQPAEYMQLPAGNGSASDQKNSDVTANVEEGKNGLQVDTAKTEELEVLHLDDVERSVVCSEMHWILIYAFYLSEYGSNSFNREIVFQKYKNSRDAGSRMSNFSNRWKSLFPNLIRTIKTNEFRLTDDGIGIAKDIISGKIASQPEINAAKKNKKKEVEEGNTQGVKKKSSSGSNGVKRLTNIDFYPSEEENLNTFYQKYVAKNDNERNLLFVYYFQEILKIYPITLNHLYTCYDHLNLRIPENMSKSVNNTKQRTGWVETKNRENLVLTTTGRNKMKFWDKKD